MQQLAAKINQHNWKRHHIQQYDTNHQDYSKEDHHLRLAANDSMEEDVSDT